MSIVDELRQSYQVILDAIEGLPTAELTRPNAIGDWSVRDVLLHIAMWEGEVLKALAVWRSGYEVDWSHVKGAEGIQKFNDFWITNLKHLSAAKVLQMLDQIHSAVIADVSAVTDEEWKRRNGVPRWLQEITIEHNTTHTRKISAYKKARQG